MSTPTPRGPRTFPNKYEATCATCGTRVQVGEGQTRKGTEGEPKWVTVHGACPSTEPEAVVQPEPASAGFAPTAEQAECVKFFATLDDLVIQAGAGAGKTSTLKLLANHALANGRRGVYTAFNKAIVVDTAGKMPGNVNCATMHSLAFAAVGQQFSHRMNSERQRPDEQARILGIDPVTVRVGGQPRELAAGWLAGQVLTAVKRFCQSADLEIAARHFAPPVDAIAPTDEAGNVDYSAHDEITRYLLPFARKAWADLTSTDGRLRFDHAVYIKLWSLSDPVINADFIMLDEAQDADPVQVSIIEQQRKRGTQIVVVGDEQQVIYEWRGAVDALGMFERMGARVAFLSQSFRFGDAVAEQANGLLSRLDARLRVRGFGPAASTVGPVSDPDAILCRSNAGAIKALLGEISKDRKPCLVGKGEDVIWFCQAALALQDGRSTQHPELACFDSWTAVQTYVEEEEQGGDLKLMVKIVDDFGADTIIDAIKHQPIEAKADVVISTAHKSKGREWTSVQIAGDFMPPKGDGDLSPAELRLAYVAVTRAKGQLDLTAVPHFFADWTPGSKVEDSDDGEEG